MKIVRNPTRNSEEVRPQRVLRKPNTFHLKIPFGQLVAQTLHHALGPHVASRHNIVEAAFFMHLPLTSTFSTFFENGLAVDTVK